MNTNSDIQAKETAIAEASSDGPKTGVSDGSKPCAKTLISLAKPFGTVDTSALSKATKKSKVTVDDAAAIILELHRAITVYSFFKVIGEYKAGRFLLMVKSLLPHGQFLTWLDESFGPIFCRRSAQRYMMTCRRIEKAIPKLRNMLAEMQPDLNFAELDDEQVVERTPTEVLAILAGKSDSNTQHSLTVSERRRILSVELAMAINNFTAVDLIVSNEDLGECEINSRSLVLGKQQLAEVADWPATIFAFVSPKQSIALAKALLVEQRKGKQRECLILLQASALNTPAAAQLLEFPQLVFSAGAPLDPSQPAKAHLTAILISDDARVADFAESFRSLGFVKIAFTHRS